MILFTGDSFSMYHTPDTWTDILTTNLKLGHWNQSLGGTSLWDAYKKIMRHRDDIKNKKFKYVILTCTSPQRIPYCKIDYEAHYTGNPAPNQRYFTEEFNKDVIHFGYFERFYEREQHNFLYKKILEEIAIDFGSHTRLIFLPCFAESYTIVKEVYNKYSNFLYTDFPLMYLYQEGYNETNHFDLPTNKLLGQFLLDKINSTSYGPMEANDQLKAAMK
jgi:hypothetical protein